LDKNFKKNVSFGVPAARLFFFPFPFPFNFYFRRASGTPAPISYFFLGKKKYAKRALIAGAKSHMLLLANVIRRT